MKMGLRQARLDLGPVWSARGRGGRCPTVGPMVSPRDTRAPGHPAQKHTLPNTLLPCHSQASVEGSPHSAPTHRHAPHRALIWPPWPSFLCHHPPSPLSPELGN